MTKKEFVQLFAVIQSNFYIQVKDKEGMRIWYASLGHISFDIAQQAIKNLLLTHTKQLVIADIINAVEDILSPQETFTEIYQILMDTLSKYGMYNMVKGLEDIQKKNSSLYKIVKSIGYRDLCMGKPDTYRVQIERMYKELIKKQRDNKILLDYKEVKKLKGDITDE